MRTASVDQPPTPVCFPRSFFAPCMRLSTDSPSLSPSLLFVPHGKFHPLPVLKFSTTHAPIYVRASAYARLPRWQDLPVSKRGERSILSRPFHPYASRRSRDRTFEESGNAFLVAARRRRAIYIRPRTMPRILLNSTFHAFPLRGIYIYIYSVAIHRGTSQGYDTRFDRKQRLPTYRSLETDFFPLWKLTIRLVALTLVAG